MLISACSSTAGSSSMSASRRTWQKIAIQGRNRRPNRPHPSPLWDRDFSSIPASSRAGCRHLPAPTSAAQTLLWRWNDTAAQPTDTGSVRCSASDRSQSREAVRRRRLGSSTAAVGGKRAGLARPGPSWSGSILRKEGLKTARGRQALPRATCRETTRRAFVHQGSEENLRPARPICR
jgi:hypothetical protein